MKPKVAFIGAGKVGTIAAYEVARRSLAREIAIIDIVEGLAKGCACDLEDILSYSGENVRITAGSSLELLKESELIVVTGGLARKPGMTREDLLQKNATIITDIAVGIRSYASHAIVIVVTNPVDVMTFLMLKQTGFPRERILGMGVNSDTARLKTILAKRFNIPDINTIHTYIVGPHTDTMIPLWSQTFIDNKPIREIASKELLRELTIEVSGRGAFIVSHLKTGSAYLCPGLSVANVIERILKATKEPITLSVYTQGEYTIQDICIGIPVRLCKTGIKEIIQLNLDSEELHALQTAAQQLKESVRYLPV